MASWIPMESAFDSPMGRCLPEAEKRPHPLRETEQNALELEKKESGEGPMGEALWGCKAVGPLLILGLLGGGALLYAHEKHHVASRLTEPGAAGTAPAGLVPAFSLNANEVHAAVKIALASETSPSNLSQFATALERAGYPHSSHELSVKASNLL
jgi:hypothetical protein